MQIQVALVAQFVQRLFFQYRADFSGIAVEYAQVRLWPVQPGIDQVGHDSSPF
ncbi:hypothetical protein D3C84_874590 [compost metagenome]